jgi:spore germination protein
LEIYVVQPGDTLFRIAQRFGLSVQELIEINRFPDPNKLVVGQAILIPRRGVEPLRYTVVSGDTLYKIAQLFGTTVQAIVNANNILDPNRIDVGMELIIPGWTKLEYTVRSGDTLWLISRRYNVSIELITKVNNLVDPSRIFPGQTLIIPQRGPAVGVKPTIETLVYIHPVNLSGLERTFADIGDLLTYAGLFQFAVDGMGDFIRLRNIDGMVNLAREFQIQPLAVITNWAEGNFQPELAHAILADNIIRSRTIENLLQILRRHNFSGVNVDFENMFPEDRGLYTDFIRELRDVLGAEGYLLTLAVAPKAADLPTFPWVGAFDYAALGQLADFIFIMTYEWGWIGGPPMAIAPINQVRRVIEYAVSQIPSEKIMEGVPLYGYDWTLPDTPENLAVALNLVEIYDLAFERGSSINCQQTTESPWFRYINAGGIEHEVWFEDARSVRAKYELILEFNLRGVGYWSYINEPYGFPQNWALLRDLFTVAKSR